MSTGSPDHILAESSKEAGPLVENDTCEDEKNLSAVELIDVGLWNSTRGRNYRI